MEVLAFSVFTYISIMGTWTCRVTEGQDKCSPLLKTGQEVQYNLLQFSVWCLWDLAISPEKKKKQMNKIRHFRAPKMHFLAEKFLLTWLRRAGPGVDWGRAAGKPSQTLWSCWAPFCPGDLWHQHRWLLPAPQWPWELGEPVWTHYSTCHTKRNKVK